MFGCPTRCIRLSPLCWLRSVASQAGERGRWGHRISGRVKLRKLVTRIITSPHNVRFRDLLGLAEALGFRVARTEGSHRILTHTGLPLARSIPRLGLTHALVPLRLTRRPVTLAKC